jgi:hypothetical protein
MLQVATAATKAGRDSLVEAAALAGSGSDAPAAPPVALTTEQLRELADKAVAVAELRVKQAAAQGVPVTLADLLVDDSWRAALSPEFSKPHMSQLQAFLAAEWGKEQIYPPQPLIFRSVPAFWQFYMPAALKDMLSALPGCRQGVQQLPHRSGQGGDHWAGTVNSSTWCRTFLCLHEEMCMPDLCGTLHDRTPTTTQGRPWG